MSTSTTGRIMGVRVTRQRLREVMPAAEVNPILWFAWDEDGDLLVAGAPTLRSLKSALNETRGSTA